MPITKPDPRESLHQHVFDHYLRTGERLTNAEWLARYERKFNPYHDEIGRFTSPPGVTVSWGDHQNSRGTAASQSRRATSRNYSAVSRVNGGTGAALSRATARPNAQASAPNSSDPIVGFRSDYVRESVNSQTSHAETYFELNKRQGYLDRLRDEAGPNANALVKADLEDFQRRLDADRERLHVISREVLDRQSLEILRAGLAPLDTAAGALNVATGDAELRDYLAVAGALPVGGTIGKLAKLAQASRAAERGAGRAISEIIQLGGAHRDIKGMAGYEAHHTPGNAVNLLNEGDGPAIAMLKEDHRSLVTSKRGPAGDIFRKIQSEHIARGDFKSAIQMDIDQIRSNFGNRYDDAIEQMIKYSREKGFIK